MGLHRLFYVPRGHARRRTGTYVTYPGEEWYAIIAPGVGAARVRGGRARTSAPFARRCATTMRRRGVMRTVRAELELRPGNEPLIAEPPAGSLAALDTHDLVAVRGLPRTGRTSRIGSGSG